MCDAYVFVVSVHVMKEIMCVCVHERKHKFSFHAFVTFFLISTGFVAM